MKKIISFMVLLAMVVGSYACTGNTSSASNGIAAFIPDKKVEVYYFHFTRRCTTCLNVENVTKKAVETLYPEKVKNGEITFKSVNLDEKDGEAIGAKYKIEGQTLIVICGNKRVDLTDKGFLYANDSPDKLKKEIKKAVDGMLK
ncbi:MAG: nitrophenyl compound nitroreductase subunit ArsF family protein [Bacteroidales bacterium]|nr:nitrophenyl compound nitroreductase subunit ArsF family protein [Bacteroidales bacterium]MDD4603426.1 nitrophenyl compound nitroreductase subunit ArsF family protein [Bacteroidales bacterium]